MNSCFYGILVLYWYRLINSLNERRAPSWEPFLFTGDLQIAVICEGIEAVLRLRHDDVIQKLHAHDINGLF